MAQERKARIVLVDEQEKASEVGLEQISSVRSGVSGLEAMTVMASDKVPDRNEAVANDDIGSVAVELTDSECDKLKDKSGIVTVEEDEVVYAFNEDADGFGDIVSDDPDATTELESEQEELESGARISDEAAEEAVHQATRAVPDVAEEVGFDESGQSFVMNAASDPAFVASADTAGIPRDKIAKFLRCVVKCALSELDGQGTSEISEDQVAALLTQNGVTGDSPAVQAIRDYITCGLRIIYAPYAWSRSTGAGVRVAVVDTGISRRHRDLRVYGGANFVPGQTSWDDDHGHGTHVAGTIAARANNVGVIGVAPNARLYAVKVLDSRGRGLTSSILNGLVWCYHRRMHVVNLSLGSPFPRHNPSQYSALYERAGRLLRRRGTLAVAAAGNSNGPVGNPARCPSYMAVSAVDCRRRRAPFSCYGPQVEIAGPGVKTWSTYLSNGYRQLSGTSMAAPHIAGTAALVKRRHPSWHGDSVRVHLWRTATDLGTPGRDWAYGYGLANAYRAVL